MKVSFYQQRSRESWNEVHTLLHLVAPQKRYKMKIQLNWKMNKAWINHTTDDRPQIRRINREQITLWLVTGYRNHRTHTHQSIWLRLSRIDIFFAHTEFKMLMIFIVQPFLYMFHVVVAYNYNSYAVHNEDTYKIVKRNKIWRKNYHIWLKGLS